MSHSFAGDTQVLTVNGTTEPIVAVRAGDRIENARPDGANEVHTVDQVHVTTADADFVDVLVDTPHGVQAVTSTRNHPFYDVSAAAFVPAGTLLPGDRLQSGTGGVVVVRAVLPHLGPMPRMAKGLKPNQNVAVYRIGNGPGARYLAAANDPGGLHSEEILNDYIKNPANGIDPEDVTGVYSERVPCTTSPHNCAATLSQYPNAKSDLSWSLDPDGIRNGAKNAGALSRVMGAYPGPADGLPNFGWVGP